MPVVVRVADDTDVPPGAEGGRTTGSFPRVLEEKTLMIATEAYWCSLACRSKKAMANVRAVRGTLFSLRDFYQASLETEATRKIDRILKSVSLADFS